VLREPALQFRAAAAKTDISPEADMRDRVGYATADVLAHPTQRKNPSSGKLHGVDDFGVRSRFRCRPIGPATGCGYELSSVPHSPEVEADTDDGNLIHS
jgi:hypothetical protein